MASTSATNLISDRSRYDQKKQRANTPTLPSPKQTNRSNTESASTASASAFEDNTDCKTINKAFNIIYDNFIGLSTFIEVYLFFLL
ncbi:hypothetical protein CIB48_g3696 [Xylaria polymorpha]|nr:hypothetical protein CIB48_g3696 [Xylaria polymorpha]